MTGTGTDYSQYVQFAQNEIGSLISSLQNGFAYLVPIGLGVIMWLRMRFMR